MVVCFFVYYRTWVYGFHTDTNMDRSVSFYSHSWTSRLPLIRHAQDLLNIINIPEILYLFFVTFQAFIHGYDSLLGIHLISVGYSTERFSNCCHDPLDLFFIHHNWVEGLLLISFIPFSLHSSFSCQCFPPSPMHAGKFSCLTPLSLHLCYIVIS
jgi:hypothetical protein